MDAAHRRGDSGVGSDFGWESASVLYRSRTFIIGASVLVALMAAGLTLMLPNQYRSSTRLLVPDQSNSLLSTLLGGTAGRAARFLGSGMQASAYSRSLALLTSRSVAEAAVDSFQLVRVYETLDEPDPRAAAVEELQERATFGVDNEYEFLFVSVLDPDPRRAAALANFFTRALIERSNTLATANASAYRRFIETRYTQATQDVDSLLDATKDFQRQYGVYDIEAQTQAFYTQLGQLRAEQVRVQAQLEGLRQQFGPESPEVRSAESVLAVATRAYQSLISGQDASLPVGQQQLPELARAYSQLERERLIQKATLEEITPLYEAARLEEQRKIDPIQVVDYAIPAPKKESPRRSLIVVAAFVSALLLSSALALLWHLWRSRGRRLLEQLRLRSSPTA